MEIKCKKWNSNRLMKEMSAKMNCLLLCDCIVEKPNASHNLTRLELDETNSCDFDKFCTKPKSNPKAKQKLKTNSHFAFLKDTGDFSLA